jgi:hypothetical protein
MVRNNNTHNNNESRELMNIYLISNDYEGCGNIAFSTQELAEQYLIDNGGDDVVRVVLDGGYSFDYTTPSPLLVAHQEQQRLEQIRSDEQFRQWSDEQLCRMCGVVNAQCECWAETMCGDNGGVTRKGAPCLNTVTIRLSVGGRCHLHPKAV